MNELMDIFQLKGLRTRHKVAVWWFLLTVGVLSMTVDAPAWFMWLALLNLAAAGALLREIRFTDTFPDDYDDGEDDEDDDDAFNC